MSMMKKFERDFVVRTMELLDRRFEKEENEVTLLLNCLLALVTLPIEREKNAAKKRFKAKQFQDNCNSRLEELSKSFRWDEINNDNQLFRNIRNSIAHLNISFELSPYGTIDYVNLKNYPDGDKSKCNFEVTISVDNLRTFAEYVAQEYINLMDNKY